MGFRSEVREEEEGGEWKSGGARQRVAGSRERRERDAAEMSNFKVSDHISLGF